MKLLRLLALVVGLAAACGTPTHQPAATGLPTTSTTTTTLPRFPAHGFVARVDDGIDVLTTDLRVVGHLAGLEPMGHDEHHEAIWVRTGNGADDRLLHLDPVAGTLLGGTPPRFVDPDKGPDLPPPAWAQAPDGRALGHWRYALRSPDGKTWLAQWSGECESQSAWFVPVAGDGPSRPAGPRQDGWALSSGAVGWLPDGRALVVFDQAACGTAIDRPGSYAIATDGTATFLHEAPLFGLW